MLKPTSTYSISLTDHFRDAFNRAGSVVHEELYDPDDSDFSDELARIDSFHPDVVFLPGHGQDSGRILMQAYALGVDMPFLGGDGWGKGVLGIAGAEATEGNYFVNHWHPDVTNPASETFVAAYRAEYGDDQIASSAALAYDAINLVALAAERAGTFDRSAIRDELAEIRGFPGVTGTITFDPQGDPVGKSGVIMMYSAGEIEFVKAQEP